MSSAYSQDCFDKVAKQAVLIDSLQKVIKDANNQFYNLATIELLRLIENQGHAQV